MDSTVKRSTKFRAVAIPIGIALVVLSIRWSGLATTLTSIGLMYVTFEYLLATWEALDLTRQNLDLLRGQVQKQVFVILHFDLAIEDRSLRLRVSNLGLSNFLLQAARVRKPDNSQVDFEMHRVVESGKTQLLGLPPSLYKDEPFDVDLEVGLYYIGLDGPGTAPSKCFNVSLGLTDYPIEVTEGLDSPWPVCCAKCNAPAFTNVYGLMSFNAANARMKQLAADLGASCPNHQSEFLLTVESVEQQRKQKRNRQSIS